MRIWGILAVLACLSGCIQVYNPTVSADVSAPVAVTAAPGPIPAASDAASPAVAESETAGIEVPVTPEEAAAPFGDPSLIPLYASPTPEMVPVGAPSEAAPLASPTPDVSASLCLELHAAHAAKTKAVVGKYNRLIAEEQGTIGGSDGLRTARLTELNRQRAAEIKAIDDVYDPQLKAAGCQ